MSNALILRDGSGKRLGRPFRIVVKRPVLEIRRMAKHPDPWMEGVLDRMLQQANGRLEYLLQSGMTPEDAIMQVQREIREQFDDADKT